MTFRRSRRRGSLLDDVDHQTIRELPPWVRRFLARCRPGCVVRVPPRVVGWDLPERDRTIRHEHWVNRRAGMGWRKSVRVLADKHELSYSAVEHIIRRSKLTPEPNLTWKCSQKVTSWRHLRGPE